MDVRPCEFINFYLSGGLATNNRISFYHTPKANDKGASYNNGYSVKTKPNTFVNVGFVIRFGKTKSIYKNGQLYNALDINNNINTGINDVQKGNGDIPAFNKKIKINNLREVSDLIETQDLY